MNARSKWTMGLFSLGAAALIGLSATAVYSNVYAQTATPETPATVLPRMGKAFANDEDHSALLAQVLGISEDELAAAQTTAHNTLIDQAVADGRITQEQADELKAQEDGRGWGRGMMGAGDDYESAFAAALGITVEELQRAHEEVQTLALAEAVAAGEITQAEADLIVARQAMQEFTRDEMQREYAASLAQAVTDGAITQAQADLLLSEQASGGFGHGGFGRGGFGPGMGGGHRGGPLGGSMGDGMNGKRWGGPGRGQLPDDAPAQPEDVTPESSSSPLFQLPSINM